MLTMFYRTIYVQEERIFMRYEVNVNAVKKQEGSLKGFATVVFEDCFKVSNIAIVENKDGELFVSMPRYSCGSEQGEYKDICNPITKEFREELYNTILSTFAEHLERGTKKTFVGGKEAHDLDFKVSVTPFEKEDSNIRGLARIFIEDSFAISNVSLLEGKNGLFVAMPSYKTKQVDENGKSVYQDVCYPITKEFREKLYDTVKDAYKQAKEQKQEEPKGFVSNKGRDQALDKDTLLR